MSENTKTAEKTEGDNDMQLTGINKKLTLASLGLDNDTLIEMDREHPKPRDIAQFYAMITDMKREPQKQDPTKHTTRFSGQFKGVNLISGETGMGFQGFFPGVAEVYLETLKHQAGEGAAMAAFVIGMEHNPTKGAAQPYKFTMKALVKTAKEANPFALLEAKLPMPKIAIAAPKAGGKK